MKRCLVLMPFSRQLRPAYDAYRRASARVNIRCYRVDDISRPGLITADIIAAIAQADIIVADLTSKNANVYYELGVAQAVGKDVILTCRKPKRLPFDIAHDRVIFYDDTKPGLRQLTRSVASYMTAAVAQPGLGSPVKRLLTATSQAVDRLNRAVVEIADRTGIPGRHLGMHVYVPESTDTVRRLARDTVRLVPSTPGSDRWRKGEGVVGSCWKTNEKALLNLRDPEYRHLTPQSWSRLEASKRVGMTLERFRAASLHFAAVLAVPVRRQEEFVGCVSLNIDRDAKPSFRQVWQAVQPILYSVAADIAGYIGQLPNRALEPTAPRLTRERRGSARRR